jgi:hypothetical protein
MLSLRTPLGLGAALSASLAASLLGATPAQAQQQAPSGGFPGGIEGTAVVGACSKGTVSAASILNTDFACQIGDKIYSNFKTILDTTGALGDSSFLFQNIGTNFSLSAFGGFTAGTYEYGYTMTVFNALASGQALSSIRTDAANAAIGGTGVPAWTKTLTALTDGPDISTVSSRAGNVSSDNGPVSFDPNDFPTSADFISKLVVDPLTNNFTPSIVDTAIQKNPKPETVPGPLPILGAAAAFGFSRKLRSRIKQSV